MNQTILIGRLTKAPELSYTTQTQTAVAKFTLAISRPKRNGEDAGADFIRITVFGKQAESATRYLGKGSMAAVLGRIHTGSYKNKEGQTVYTTDVIAERVEFLTWRDNRSDEEQATAPVEMGDMPDCFQPSDDDVPF